jgi:hypothetical protein
MYEQLNEFKYKAETGRSYIIYFLKFWQAEGKEGDYVVKYQVRSEEKDFVWYGRISVERALTGLNIDAKELKSQTGEEIKNKIKTHLQKLLLAVLTRGLDKGYEEPNIEFVFCKEPPITKRTWRGS